LEVKIRIKPYILALALGFLPQKANADLLKEVKQYLTPENRISQKYLTRSYILNGEDHMRLNRVYNLDGKMLIEQYIILRTVPIPHNEESVEFPISFFPAFYLMGKIVYKDETFDGINGNETIEEIIKDEKEVKKESPI
jgi:hypothetical protein